MIARPSEPEVCYVGIDPGKTGAVAVIHGRSKRAFVASISMDANDLFLQMPVLGGMTGSGGHLRIMVEHVGCAPVFGTKGNWGLALAFGQILVWLRLTFPAAVLDLVKPPKWKAEFGLNMTKQASKEQKKARDLAKARSLFPLVKILDDNQADALLLAEYCRRVNR